MRKSVFLGAVSCLVFVLSVLFSSVWAINTPADPRGTEVAQSLVKWEWARVPGAVHYEVTVDGINRGLTRDPQFYSSNLWAGEHSMTVRAVDSSGRYSGSTRTVKIIVNSSFSSASASRSFYAGQAPSSTSSVAPAPPPSSNSGTIQTPQNTRGTEVSAKTVKWEWDAVSGAVSYDVTVDGIYAGSTSGLEYTSNNLWIGEHSMTVKAVSSSGAISEQSGTVKLNVVGAASSNSNSSGSSNAATAPPPPQPTAGDPNAANVQNFIDPASWSYPEVYQKEGYELSFSDEFNGTALNPYRWNTQLRWDGEWNGERYEYRVVNGEDQFYVNIFSSDQEHRDKVLPVYNPFEFNGSRLAIRASKNPLKTNNNERLFGSLDQMVSQQTFLSGAIATHGKFSQKYGYFEARIKIPSHVGTFPAFWLFHERRAWEGTQRTEIDVMENLGHAPWYIYNSFHYFKNVTTTYSGDAHFVKPYPNGQIYTGIDYSQNYHVYAVEWEPGRVRWFIDGQVVSTLEHGEVNYEELYLKLNLAMGGHWTNFPANAGGLGRESWDHFPNQNDLNNFANPALEIDYVRAYRRK